MNRRRLCAAVMIAGLAVNQSGLLSAGSQRSIGELKPRMSLHVGETADWVEITDDAVWVGSTGPFAVHRIDPETNRKVAEVSLPGEPCAGLAAGLGSLWVPLCGDSPMLAKVDLKSNRLVKIFKIGPVAEESGVAVSSDSVWVVVDGSLLRMDPETGEVRKKIVLPAGSYNPHYSDDSIWVTRAGGAEITRVDAASGKVLATIPTGPGPRFLTAGAGSIWTLNQGDGSVTRIDSNSNSTKTIALETPGHGGDIKFGGNLVWTTMRKVPLSVIDPADTTLLCQWVGPGGDSLGVGHGSIWLTDYNEGNVERLDIEDAMSRCNAQSRR